MAAYHFRAFSRADLPLAARWLQTPEVARWWGDAKEQLALITEDLDQPLMQQWIVEHEGRPFAYVQAHSPQAWPQSHLIHLPDGAKLIDAFIGEPAMIGRGHGSGFLRAMAEKMLAEGAPVVAMDPGRDNFRARRAYARAGFVGDDAAETDAGPVVLMLFSPSALSRSSIARKSQESSTTPVF